MITCTCPTCKTVHGISEEIHQTAKARPDEMNVYCPNGHPWVYRKGETELDKMRRERDRLKQDIAYKDDRIASLFNTVTDTKRSLVATKGHLTRTRKRISHGVCPCCNRSFENLKQHMGTKHPDFYRAEAL